MPRISLLIKAIDKKLVEKNKNYLTLGQANKMLYEKGHITEYEKQSGFLKKLLENNEIKNSQQTEFSPKQWRIFISDERLKNLKPNPKKQKIIKNQKQTFSKKSNDTWKWVAVGLFLLMFISRQCSDENNGSFDSNPILAYNYAKDFIKNRLKSPSTAKFPGTFEKKNHIMDLGNGEYRINSWVDSQNSFGAIIRSRWSCKIIFNGENVRAENIIIQQ